MANILMIILTGFAVLGVWFVCDLAIKTARGIKSPQTVTFIKYSESDGAYYKILALQTETFNNKIVLIGDGDENIYSGLEKIKKCEISDFIENHIFT